VLIVGHDRFPTYYGSELTSVAVVRWAAERVQWHYIQPGKPIQNAFIESFNSRLRDESQSARLPESRRSPFHHRRLA
jgi:transposase InsO family protein